MHFGVRAIRVSSQDGNVRRDDEVNFHAQSVASGESRTGLDHAFIQWFTRSMLVMTNSGRIQNLGEIQIAPDEEAQVPRLADKATTLSQQEAHLRKTFADLLPDLVALQNAGATLPPVFVDLLQRYNGAQATFMQAAGVWLQARAQTPKDLLPDPAAQPIAIPTFELPAAGFSGLAAIPAQAIKIKYGIIGKEVSTPLAGYLNSPFAGYFSGTQLGLPPGFIYAVVVGLAIVGATIVLVARYTKTSDTAAANIAATELAKSRTEEVKSDNDLYRSTRDACIGDSTDPAVRLKCVQAAAAVLKAAKEGRPTTKPIAPPSGLGVLSVIGAVTVLAIAGGVGYLLYKRRRRQRAGLQLPRAVATSRAAE
jgi:hypothetical protein